MSQNKELFTKFVKTGVLPREQVKNQRAAVQALMRSHFVRKAHKKGHVFYELTENALPLLDHYRKQLLEDAQLQRALHPRRSAFYDALLTDLRFFDTTKPEAKQFQFLGDWRLTNPPLPAQLHLAQLRYYQAKGLA